jgi:hypothetical protein
MHKIKEMLMNELYEYEEKAKKMSGGKISAGDLETIHKLTDTVKNIDKIEMLEEDGGYSEATDFMGEGRMYGTSYNDGGGSYARGRGRNARRDRMGRYSRDGGSSYAMGGRETMHESGNYHGGYSRDGAKEHMIEKLEDMMEEASTDKEREAIRHCIQKIENA